MGFTTACGTVLKIAILERLRTTALGACKFTKVKLDCFVDIHGYSNKSLCLWKFLK